MSQQNLQYPSDSFDPQDVSLSPGDCHSYMFIVHVWHSVMDLSQQQKHRFYRKSFTESPSMTNKAWVW